MNKLIIFVDGNGKLVSEYNGEMLSAKKTHSFIQTFNTRKIKEIKEDEENESVLIKYKDLDVYIKSYLKIFESYRTFKPIIFNAKKYEEKQSCKVTKLKKVVRKNKYAIEKTAIAGITAIILVGVAFNIENIHAVHDENSNIEPTTYIEQVPQISSDNNIIKDEVTGEVTTYVMTFDEAETIAESETSIVEEDTTKMPVEEKNIIELSYENKVDDEKNTYTKKNYSDLITKYSKIYGLDPNLMIALATQESGKHSINTNGSAIGLMQLEKGVWKGSSINVYNFETKSWEKVVLDESKFYDLEYNIESACRIMQYSLNTQDYNILIGLQSYNLGSGNMNKVLNACAYNEGVTKQSLLDNQFSTVWLAYRYFASGGDKKYLEHLFQYLGDNFTLSFEIPEGNTISITVKNKEKTKVY